MVQSGKNNSDSNRRGDRWHVGREIPLAVIVALVGVAVSNVVAYNVFKKEMQLYMEYSDQKFLAYSENIDERFNTIDKEMAERTKDRIHKSTVVEMFRSRDMQINGMSANMIDIKKGISELNSLLHEMRRDLLKGKNTRSANSGA